RCEGTPSVCPPGMAREQAATVCTPVACTDGRVRASDHVACCWPGQRVEPAGVPDGGHAGGDDSHAAGVCAGPVATCPEGTSRLDEDDCAPATGPASAPPRRGIPRDAAWIPGGTFRAGSGDRVITLAPYGMDRTEVTVAQYTACVRAGRCDPARDAFVPVTAPRMPRAFVTHAMARAYCGFAGGRLPTEAEWELAARGFDRRVFPWGDRRPDCSLARMAGCGDGPALVGSLPGGASPFGVQDLAGNLAEWVADRSGTLGTGSEWNPAGPREGDSRVVRGGSSGDAESALRTTARRAVDPREGRYDVGFRCAY
ncbi:MAG: formylglycine-generating enzyme family protein, partial [Deltaproteobacteria bacterium]